MIETSDFIGAIVGAALLAFFIGILSGFGIATPDTLENDCITHNSKLYCEYKEIVNNG